MANNATNLANAFKTYFVDKVVGKIVYTDEDRPFLNMLNKDPNFSGDGMPVPVWYGDAAAGRSVSYSNAVANANNAKIARFTVDVVQNNQIVEVTREALLRGRSNAGSFFKNQVIKVEQGINNLSNDIEMGLFRDGTGKIGAVGSIASAVITLATADDARNFHPDQVLVMATNTATNLHSGTVTVSSVDIDAGTVTCTGNVTAGISSATAGDAIFVQGDYTAANNVLKISGLDGWLTGTSTLFGQDRSVDSRLQGSSGTGSLGDIAKGIRDLAYATKKKYTAKPNVAFVDWEIYGRLVDQLGADVRRDEGGMATDGFESVTVIGPGGPIRVVGAAYCPPNKAYVVDMRTLSLVSMGPVVTLNMDDGQAAERMSSESGLRVHIDSHANLACNAPARNGIVTYS